MGLHSGNRSSTIRTDPPNATDKRGCRRIHPAGDEPRIRLAGRPPDRGTSRHSTRLEKLNNPTPPSNWQNSRRSRENRKSGIFMNRFVRPDLGKLHAATRVSASFADQNIPNPQCANPPCTAGDLHTRSSEISFSETPPCDRKGVPILIQKGSCLLRDRVHADRDLKNDGFFLKKKLPARFQPRFCNHFVDS